MPSMATLRLEAGLPSGSTKLPSLRTLERSHANAGGFCGVSPHIHGMVPLSKNIGRRIENAFLIEA